MRRLVRTRERVRHQQHVIRSDDGRGQRPQRPFITDSLLARNNHEVHGLSTGVFRLVGLVW